MCSDPRVTIITNVYNEEQNLPGYLDSLTRQTFSEFEILIVDDGSTDKTLEIVKEYAGKLHTRVISLPHVGLIPARAIGFENVRGEIAIILDADEVVDESCIEKLVEEFAHPDTGAVGGNVVYSAEDEGWLNKGAFVLGEARFLLRYGPDGTGDFVQGGCMALRVSAVKSVGGLSKDPLIREDVDISWRLRKAGWKLRGRGDAIVYHPTEVGEGTIIELLRFGYRTGVSHVPLMKARKDKIFYWKVWMRFVPLALTLSLLTGPIGLSLTLMSLVGALFLMRGVRQPLRYKVYAWVYFMIQDIGWAVGFLVGCSRSIVQRCVPDYEQV